MRQEELCHGTILGHDKPRGTKFKCPKCGRRLTIARTGDKFYIPQHNPKGWKKQKKKNRN